MDKSIREYSVFNEFTPNFKILAIVGYMRIVFDGVSQNTKTFQNIYRHFVVFVTALYNIQHIIFVIQERQNSDLLVDSLFMLLTTLFSLSKQIIFNYANGINDLIDIIKDDKFAPTHRHHVNLLKENSLQMFKLLILFVVSVETSCIIYPIYHYLNRNKFGVTSYIPFDVSQSPKFEITIVYLALILSGIGIGNAAMDITIIAFYSQARIQLRILRFNLEHLTDPLESPKIAREEVNTGRNEYFQDITDGAYRKLVQSRVIKCVEHYKHITRLTDKVQAVFAIGMSFQVLACAWVNCITVYKAIGLNVMSAEFLSMFVYLSCIIFELYIHCYYGTQLEDESQYVNQSLYFCDWLKLSPNFRKQLVIMAFCYCRPIQLKVAFIVPLSLNTFISVLKASYSLFTILRT